MSFLLYSPTTYAVSATILVLGYALYRAALPKPIPGIPYNKNSARSILGDLPSLIKYQRSSSAIFDWVTLQGLELNAPVYQLFLGPFTRPKVVLLDHREARDILMQRTKEFDRSQFLMDVFSGTIPNHQVAQPTGDKWRAQRRLLADTVATEFLQKVSAPSLRKQAIHLVDLWRLKSKQAAGSAFSIQQDIRNAITDAIWVLAFGTEMNSITSHVDYLARNAAVTFPEEPGAPATFSLPPNPAAPTALQLLMKKVEVAVQSPLPLLAHWFVRQTPEYRKARAIKDRYISDAIRDAQSRLSDGKATAETDTCACDHLIRREQQQATKEGRAPVFDSPNTRDELFGYLIAGVDTSATTLQWIMKFLADHQEVQKSLRQAVRDFFPHATSHDLPTAEQMSTAAIPYLDAFLDETFRISQLAPAVSRVATSDTTVLGFHIPKQTDVLIMLNGPGYLSGPVGDPIEERHRSKTSQEHKDKIPDWNPQNIATFEPERWLKHDEKGSLYYDPNAGPLQAFGGGARGCFGKKLGLMQAKFYTIVIILSFNIKGCPKDLSGYVVADRVARVPLQCYGSFEPL